MADTPQKKVPPAPENKPYESKKSLDGAMTTLKPAPFGTSGSVLASKGKDGENYYVCILDAEIGPPTQYLQLIDVLYHAKKGDIVNIKISSYGGHVETGMHIIQAIHNTQAHVITTGMAVVASIASVIWFCGHERRMMPGSALMIHMPSGGQYGKTADIEEESHQLQTFFANLLRTIGKGIVTEEEFTRIIENREDTFIPADEVNKRLTLLRENNYA